MVAPTLLGDIYIHKTRSVGAQKDVILYLYFTNRKLLS